jgi:colanic acid/amylovoran biosynthesis glycosyltransferase
VASPTKLLYLIGQYPAINHGYLLAEIRHLRRLGLQVSVASVSGPDRPMEQLSPVEREEASSTYYIKSVPLLHAVVAQIAEAARHPWRYLRGLVCALQLAGASIRGLACHLAYFVEAVLVGREMRRRGLSHVHASFSATVGLITARTFPVTMSFGVYGFGELHDPVTTCLAARIAGALFVRSISRHGRGQSLLSCTRSEWSKLVYVPLGIDPAEFSPRPHRPDPSPIRLLCVGRLSPEKGQVFLLNAMGELCRSGIPLRLHLVGDGPDRAWLESEASSIGVVANVEFEGWVDQRRLMTLYVETDVFVLPSLAEGIPIVMMEAMAMEIPCVAPYITGIPELIQDGVDGMLFHVADVDDLVRVIRRLIESPELRVKIGQRARARVERQYDMARNTERWAGLLRQRLEARSADRESAGEARIELTGVRDS